MTASESSAKSSTASENPANNSIQQLACSVLLNNIGLFNNYQIAKLNPLKQGLTNTLIDHVANGRLDEAKVILAKFPELLLEKGTGINIAGTEWKGTAFQYAVWAWDTDMYNMMLDCLPQNEQGEEIRKDLLKQAKKQKEHFDFNPLITALKTYLQNFDAWNWAQRIKQWCEVVGGAQQTLPAHVRYEYCNPDRSFYPVPSFTEKTVRRSLMIYNWNTNTWLNWKDSLSGLGSDFAICRGEGRVRYGKDGPARGRLAAANVDLEAITALRDVRTADLASFLKRLETPIQNLETTLKPHAG